MTEQVKVSGAMWRVVEAARVALVAMPVHRDSVLRVARIEQTLVPAIETFIPASEALFAINTQRKALLPLQAAHLEELHARTLYWLTYVRQDVPRYEASKMGSRADSVKVAIDRAQRVLTLLRLDAQPRDFAEPLMADLGPLYERSVRERSELDAIALERTRLRARARALMAPVVRDITTLRGLLRNALGAAHPHVRGLIMTAPKKPKSGDAAEAKKKPKVVKEKKLKVVKEPKTDVPVTAPPGSEVPVAAE